MTMTQIARQAGLSVSRVSRIIAKAERLPDQSSGLDAVGREAKGKT